MNEEKSIKEKILIEALKLNWENARYHESSRWKYTYYFYAGIGAFLIYFINELNENTYQIFSFSPNELLFYGAIYIFLGFIGRGSYYHLVYSNTEFKNHIRAIEFIARDLKLNKNISQYREGNKEIQRYAYMALPLILGIRKEMPFTVFTALVVSINFSFGLFLLLIWLVKKHALDLFIEGGDISVLLIIFTFVIAIVLLNADLNKNTNYQISAENELRKRDPGNYKK